MVDPRFPACLRELRQGAGLSVRAFAGRAYVSRSYISELENGRKPPTVAIARRLDDALHAGGELAGLVTLAAPDGVTRDDTDRLAYAVQHPRRLDVATIDVLATLLAGQRRLEDVLGAATVLTPVAAQVAMVEELVDGARGLLRPRMVAVGAEWPSSPAG
ncbi:MAG TPA: helix-turn-helix transcriptional regulator [Micromonosporaceae bacterium]|nr:helix-turn-helix transcriptional regulator [Micromonosporaceae bacterium]